MNRSVRSGYGRPVLVSITQVCVTISGWMSQSGIDQVADELEAVVQLLASPARHLAIDPADAGRVGDDAVLAFDAVLAAPLAELADEASGISRGSFRQSCLYRSGKTSANCGMQKWARFTRQVESSMIKLTGTRPRGLSTSTPSAIGGRSPRSWERALIGSDPASAAPTDAAADCVRNSRRLIGASMDSIRVVGVSIHSKTPPGDLHN